MRNLPPSHPSYVPACIRDYTGRQIRRRLQKIAALWLSIAVITTLLGLAFGEVTAAARQERAALEAR